MEGRGLARWRCLAVGHEATVTGRFPGGSLFFVSLVSALRFQPPPVNPCMRFSRTRLTDIVHRQACVLCQVIVPESRWTPKRRYQA